MRKISQMIRFAGFVSGHYLFRIAVAGLLVWLGFYIFSVCDSSSDSSSNFSRNFSSESASDSSKRLDTSLVPRSQPPQRIVSTYLGADEVVFDLLSRAGKLSSLVGVSHFVDKENYSNLAGRIPPSIKRIGGEVESVLALNPDLVIAASFNNPKMIEKLKDFEVPVVVNSQFASTENIVQQIRNIGDVLQLPAEANELISRLEKQLGVGSSSETDVQMPTAARKVINYSSELRVFGSGTLFDSLVTGAGFDNLASSELKVSGWPVISREEFMKLEPDVIVVTVPHQGSRKDLDKLAKAIVAKDPVWQVFYENSNSFANAIVVGIPQAWILATSHYIGKAMEHLHQVRIIEK